MPDNPCVAENAGVPVFNAASSFKCNFIWTIWVFSECYPYRFIVIIASGHFWDRDFSYRSKAWGNLVLMLRHC